MKYHQLQIASNKSSRRVGRGISAGQGKTAGRGTKGQKSRAGSSRKPGFEGGQNSLIQRLPKLRGFKSHRVSSEIVLTSQIDKMTGTIDNAKLSADGLVSNPFVSVKLLFDKPVTKKLNVKLQAASQTAKQSIEKKGGSFTQIAQQGRLATKKIEDNQKANK